MTPQQLKNSILQLAFQGKLVEQRPEEGTGEELFREIQAEKARLVKAGKIKKEKPLPEIAEDELPFEIPGNWKWVRLEMLATINGGYAFKSTDYSTEGVRVIRISDFNENGFVNTKIVRHPYRKEFEQFLLNKNNILLCMTGGTVGKSLFVTELNEIMMVNQRVATIKIQFALPEYINFNILAPLIQSIIQHSKNSTNDNISMETIKSFPIPLPPLAEQKRIVAKIEELLPLVDRYEKAWSQLEAYNKRFPADMQKAILQWAIQGKLVEQRPEEGTGEELYRQIQAEKARLIKAGKIRKEKPLPEIAEDELPFEIPENWKWVRLAAATDMLSGFAFKSEEFKQNGKFRLLRGINLGVNTVRWNETVYVDSLSEQLYSYKLQKGDVLLGLDRPWINDGTRVGIFNEDRETYLVQRVLRLRDIGCLTSSFIALILHSSLLKNALGGETTGISVPHISPKQVGNIVVPIPPLAEQKRIVAKIEELLPLCDALKGKIHS